MRRSDSAICWAPDQFLVLLPAMDLRTAEEIAERVRTATRRRAVTISAAVAEVPPGEEFDSALRRVTEQLK